MSIYVHVFLCCLRKIQNITQMNLSAYSLWMYGIKKWVCEWHLHTCMFLCCLRKIDFYTKLYTKCQRLQLCIFFLFWCCGRPLDSLRVAWSVIIYPMYLFIDFICYVLRPASFPSSSSLLLYLPALIFSCWVGLYFCAFYKWLCRV